MDYRIFVEKRPEFRVEAESLRNELNSNLGLDIKELRLFAVYDLFGFTPELLEKTRRSVFGEIATDEICDTMDLSGTPHLAYEALPGQFDQRAASARECVRLLQPDAEVEITAARLMTFDPSVAPADIERVAKYCINTVESRRKNLEVLHLPERAHANPVKVLEGLREITPGSAR